MTDSKPATLETKTFITGASDKEVQIGYSPAPVPFKDGMADGQTPGTTNTPGPYEAPADAKGESETPETSDSSETGKSAPAKKTSPKS